MPPRQGLVSAAARLIGVPIVERRDKGRDESRPGWQPCSRHITLLLFFTLPAWAADPPFHVLDIDRGETQSALGAKVALVDVIETRDPVQSAVREARVRVRVNNNSVELSCGNYQLPIATGKVQIDCPVTKGYRTNSTTDHWGLRKDARLRIWPANSPWIDPPQFGYPLKQRWFLTHTQMANEPTYVDRGERFSRKRVYYHAGLDIGGPEALAEIVAATDGLIVSLGKQTLPDHEKDTPVAPRYDVIYLLDSRGWYYRYSHLHSFDPTLQLGQRVRKGQRLGLLGKEGGSGGWSHLHFEAVARQPSGLWGTQEGFAFLWQAYLREHGPDLVAFARPHRFAVTGEKVLLDASRSWSRSGKIRSHEWSLSNGATVRAGKAGIVYTTPGTYSEVLKVTDASGRVSYDFATVNVLDPARSAHEPPTIHAAYFPSFDLRRGQAITFKVRTFGTTNGEEKWDFGDGSTATTRSDGNVKQLDPDGYAVIRHTYAQPGNYIVKVSREDANGLTATTHLWVPVQ